MKRSRRKFKIDVFLNKITTLKEEFCIESSYKRSGDTNAKRIAILVNDCYLECNGGSYWASVLERRIYEEVKRENLICDPIPYENHREENKKKNKSKKLNPLKLSLEHLDRIDGYHPTIVYLTNRVIRVLKAGGTKSGRENGEHIERRSIVRVFGRKQINHKRLERSRFAPRSIGK